MINLETIVFSAVSLPSHQIEQLSNLTGLEIQPQDEIYMYDGHPDGRKDRRAIYLITRGGVPIWFPQVVPKESPDLEIY